MQCPLHNQKVNKPSFHGTSCQLAPFNSQTIWTSSTVLTNNIVVAASVVYGEWRWQLFPNLMNSVLSPICLLVSLNAEVLVVVIVVGCVQGSWSQVSTFSCYSHCSPQFSRICAIIQIKYVLPKLCHLPQYSYGSRDPTTRVLGYASYPGLGTRDSYSYWGRWHSMATHT